MATDPGPLFRSPAEEQHFRQFVRKYDRDRPSFLSALGTAANGAVLGALIGWSVHRKEAGQHHVGKHALHGALIGGGIGLLGYFTGKSFSKFFHFVDAEGRREMAGQPMKMETWLEDLGHMPPGSLRVQQQALYAQQPEQYAAGWWGEHHFDPWQHHGWGEHQHHEQPWWHRHRHFSRQRPWHEEVVAPPLPPMTFGPASDEDQAAVYAHGGLQ